MGPKHFSAIKGLLRLNSSLTPSVSFSSCIFQSEKERNTAFGVERERESNNGGVAEMVQCRLIAGNNAAFYKRQGLQGEGPAYTFKVCFKSYHFFLSFSTRFVEILQYGMSKRIVLIQTSFFWWWQICRGRGVEELQECVNGGQVSIVVTENFSSTFSFTTNPDGSTWQAVQCWPLDIFGLAFG